MLHCIARYKSCYTSSQTNRTVPSFLPISTSEKPFSSIMSSLSHGMTVPGIRSRRWIFSSVRA